LADDAHESGRLLGLAKTRDLVDAFVALVAARHSATILTSDPADLKRLIRASGADVAVVAV
jgi:predicted nucleic acid-binding protein